MFLSSLNHFLHYFALDRAVSVALPIEILSPVPDPMSRVSRDRNLESIVLFLFDICVLSCSHRSLEPVAQCLILRQCFATHLLKTRSQRVHVEERVLPVVDGHCGGSVQGLEALVTDGRHLQVDVPALDLDALELGVVEVGHVFLVPDVRRLHSLRSVIHNPPEVVLVVFLHVGRPEPLLRRQTDTLHELMVNGLARRFRE